MPIAWLRVRAAASGVRRRNWADGHGLLRPCALGAAGTLLALLAVTATGMALFGEEAIWNPVTLRNLALALAAAAGALIIGIPLAVWRSCVAHRQAETAERRLLHERYQKGSEMLGHAASAATRIGGIHALGHLASDRPGEFHVQIRDLLCAFVRQPRRDAEGPAHRFSDVEAAITVIGRRGDRQVALDDAEDRERRQRQLEGVLNLERAVLAGASLHRVNLSGAWLAGVDFQKAKLDDVDLSGAELREADFSKARLGKTSFCEANLAESRFAEVELEGADFSCAKLHEADFERAQKVRGSQFPSARMYAVRLRGLDLSFADFTDAKMERADLRESNLSHAKFIEAEMLHAELSGARLSYADFTDADLYSADLAGANMAEPEHAPPAPGPGESAPPPGGPEANPAPNFTGANLSHVTGLTQAMLDQARAAPGRGPKLDGARCAETGEPLIWKGGARRG